MKNFDDLIEKAKEMGGKAEKVIEEGFEKAKTSGNYDKITGLMGQVGDYIDKKIDVLKQGDLSGKIENLRNQADTRSETIIDHVKSYGTILADDLDEVLKTVKEKLAGDEKIYK